MKSSTIGRSTLSKESMEVIENLSKEQDMNDDMNEYLRAEDENKDNGERTKSQEIDLLWQNFKTTQFSSNSPTMYIIIGFIIGVILTIVVMFGINYFSSNSNLFKTNPVSAPVENQQVDEDYTQEDTNVDQATVPTSEETAAEKEQSDNATAPADIDTSKMTKYVVKNGDTGESIIKHHYGAYTPERAERIMKANHLTTLDRINIDQVLWMPAE